MPVAVGFIGCGEIARVHMRSLARIAEAELTAFCDVEAERAEACSRNYGGTAYDDHRRMLDAEELDAVFVCIPPFAHRGQEVLAAKKGCALFLEAPVALTSARAEQIAEAVRKTGVICSVDYHWRYARTVQRMQKEARKQPIGMVLGWWMSGLRDTPWRRTAKRSGGQNIEQATHIFDLARCVAGEVDRVFASYALRCLGGAPDLDVPDVGSVNVEFQNGVVGSIVSSCCLRQGYKTGLALIGRDSSMEVGPDELTIRTPDETRSLHERKDPRLEAVREFILAVRKRDASKVLCTIEDAAKTLAVTLAAAESARSGKPVAM
jgi:myo-inositol 2-dehydrogenase/D-chiro-inositol 1-dehydrogenase